MKIIRNEKAFTLVEMLVVMLVISILLILIIPNVMKQQKSIQTKGCDAYVKNVQAQVQGYILDQDGKIPTVDALLSEGYISQDTCPHGDKVIIANDGTVSAAQ